MPSDARETPASRPCHHYRPPRWTQEEASPVQGEGRRVKGEASCTGGCRGCSQRGDGWIATEGIPRVDPIDQISRRAAQVRIVVSDLTFDAVGSHNPQLDAERSSSDAPTRLLLELSLRTHFRPIDPRTSPTLHERWPAIRSTGSIRSQRL